MLVVFVMLISAGWYISSIRKALKSAQAQTEMVRAELAEKDRQLDDFRKQLTRHLEAQAEQSARMREMEERLEAFDSDMAQVCEVNQDARSWGHTIVDDAWVKRLWGYGR